MTLFRMIAFGAVLTVGMASATAQTLPPEVLAQMPSKSEMRQQMLDQGMDAAMIEQVLSSDAFAGVADDPAVSKTARPEDVCVDTNSNDICDDEENDPVVTRCRTKYMDAIADYTRRTYGDRLGKTGLRIAQTCSTAAVGASYYYGLAEGQASTPGASEAWYIDMPLMSERRAYWDPIISYYRYLAPESFEGITEDNIDQMTDDQLARMMDQIPPELMNLITPSTAIPGTVGGSQSAVRDAADATYAKCQDILNQVRGFYKSSIPGERVCISYLPGGE